MQTPIFDGDYARDDVDVTSAVQRRFNEMGLLLQFEHGHPILPLNFDLFTSAQTPRNFAP